MRLALKNASEELVANGQGSNSCCHESQGLMLDGAVHSVKIIEAVAIARNLKKSDRRTISKLAPVMMGYTVNAAHCLLS